MKANEENLFAKKAREMLDETEASSDNEYEDFNNEKVEDYPDPPHVQMVFLQILSY